MPTWSQWHRASGSRAHCRRDLSSPRARDAEGTCLASQQASLRTSVLPTRAAVDFLRNLASLTGARYHCPVDEDTLFKIHGLLTKGFVDERVGCGATE